MTSDADLLAQIDAAFADVGKPEHFTDYRHCCECAEHDETLRNHDRDSLELRHVGKPGRDPLCFASPQGQAYYLPALVRLALAPPSREYGWYADQLLFHLSSGGAWNQLYCYCTSEQRRAVAALLAHLVKTRTEAFDGFPEEDRLLQAYALWSAA